VLSCVSCPSILSVSPLLHGSELRAPSFEYVRVVTQLHGKHSIIATSDLATHKEHCGFILVLFPSFPKALLFLNSFTMFFKASPVILLSMMVTVVSGSSKADGDRQSNIIEDIHSCARAPRFTNVDAHMHVSRDGRIIMSPELGRAYSECVIDSDASDERSDSVHDIRDTSPVVARMGGPAIKGAGRGQNLAAGGRTRKGKIHTPPDVPFELPMLWVVYCDTAAQTKICRREGCICSGTSRMYGCPEYASWEYDCDPRFSSLLWLSSVAGSLFIVSFHLLRPSLPLFHDSSRL
jgi:hypothetical protein